MTKTEYKTILKRHGYTFKSDTAYLKTPYGVMTEKIVKDKNGYALITVSNPVSNPLRSNSHTKGEQL